MARAAPDPGAAARSIPDTLDNRDGRPAPRRQHRGPHHDQARARPFRPADPSLTFGGNVFGWTVDEAGACSLLDAMVDAGLNFIDTADVYSRWAPGNQGGESETLIGKWIKRSGRRSRVLLATKVGMEMGPGRKGLAPAYIRQSLEASLSRLQTDYVDLYQSHQDDPDTPLTDTLGAYARLMEAGKVRAIGASNYVRAPVRGPDRQRAPQPAALRKRAA